MNAKDLRTIEYSSYTVFITGGTKSGKSEFAEYLAKEEKNLSYVALCEKNINDKVWQDKINSHQKRITKISKDNWLAINGRAIKIDEISVEIPS